MPNSLIGRMLAEGGLCGKAIVLEKAEEGRFSPGTADGRRSHSLRRTRPLPPTAPAPPQAGYGDATVTPRRDYGEAPMGTDPHGSLTGISPG